jgi:hypothetical protein
MTKSNAPTMVPVNVLTLHCTYVINYSTLVALRPDVPSSPSGASQGAGKKYQLDVVPLFVASAHLLSNPKVHGLGK